MQAATTMRLREDEGSVKGDTCKLTKGKNTLNK